MTSPIEPTTPTPRGRRAKPAVDTATPAAAASPPGDQFDARLTALELRMGEAMHALAALAQAYMMAHRNDYPACQDPTNPEERAAHARAVDEWTARGRVAHDRVAALRIG
jgi:hypothetical protein